MILLGQAARHQPDDAGRGVRVGYEDQVSSRARLHSLAGTGQRRLREPLSLAVQRREGAGQLSSLPFVATEEQVEGLTGMGQTTGGVEAWAQDPAHGPGVHLPPVQACLLDQGAQARAFASRKGLQPFSHQPAVLVQEGHQIGDGAQGHQLQEAVARKGASQRLVEGRSQLVGETYRGQLRLGIAAVGPARVHQGGRRRQVGREGVVVQHQHVHAQP